MDLRRLRMPSVLPGVAGVPGVAVAAVAAVALVALGAALAPVHVPGAGTLARPSLTAPPVPVVKAPPEPVLTRAACRDCAQPAPVGSETY